MTKQKTALQAWRRFRPLLGERPWHAVALAAASVATGLVAIGASTGFLTPLGYQTSMVVWGLGGYRFSDFARIGWTVTLPSIVIVLGNKHDWYLGRKLTWTEVVEGSGS